MQLLEYVLMRTAATVPRDPASADCASGNQSPAKQTPLQPTVAVGRINQNSKNYNTIVFHRTAKFGADAIICRQLW